MAKFNWSNNTVDHFVELSDVITLTDLIERILEFVELNCCDGEDDPLLPDLYEDLVALIIKRVTFKKHNYNTKVSL